MSYLKKFYDACASGDVTQINELSISKLRRIGSCDAEKGIMMAWKSGCIDVVRNLLLFLTYEDNLLINCYGPLAFIRKCFFILKFELIV